MDSINNSSVKSPNTIHNDSTIDLTKENDTIMNMNSSNISDTVDVIAKDMDSQYLSYDYSLDQLSQHSEDFNHSQKINFDFKSKNLLQDLNKDNKNDTQDMNLNKNGSEIFLN